MITASPAIVDGMIDGLSDVMEFGHVIRVTSEATIIEGGELAGIHAPELDMEVDADGQAIHGEDSDLHSQAEAQGWELLTGYTGQYGYNGPVMHASEYIGGGLARDILETPGIYAAVIVEVMTLDGDPDAEPAGWAIARKV